MPFPPTPGRPGLVMATVAVGRSVQQQEHAGVQETPDGPRQILATVTRTGGSTIEISPEDAAELLAGGFIDHPNEPAAASRPRNRIDGQPTVNGKITSTDYHPT